MRNHWLFLLWSAILRKGNEFPGEGFFFITDKATVPIFVTMSMCSYIDFDDKLDFENDLAASLKKQRIAMNKSMELDHTFIFSKKPPVAVAFAPISPTNLPADRQE